MMAKIIGVNSRNVLTAILLILICPALRAQNSGYLGFDRNEYPGDANLAILRQTFSYTGYWLNTPPSERANSWAGHRAAVEKAGFGFLVLFNGRLYAELKSEAKARRLGESDARAAAAAARREGFPRATVIFLDQEQGGRMLPEQNAYIFAWVDGVTGAGFRAGIYCSGMPAPTRDHTITAEDIREHAADWASGSAGKSARATETATREITYWVTDDACPPAPGCAFPKHPPSPAESGVRFAEVWQFAQSPERKDVAAHCTNYSRDGNCHPPGIPAEQKIHIDLNTATSPDPSHGRTHSEPVATDRH